MKFIKGAIELDKNVTDLTAYEEPKKNKLDEIVEWCNKYNVYIIFGTSDDNTYLCEYKVVANTKAMCKGVVKELKEILKGMFPCANSIWTIEGTQLY